jgi:hypothetical protein
MHIERLCQFFTHHIAKKKNRHYLIFYVTIFQDGSAQYFGSSTRSINFAISLFAIARHPQPGSGHIPSSPLHLKAILSPLRIKWTLQKYSTPIHHKDNMSLH